MAIVMTLVVFSVFVSYLRTRQKEVLGMMLFFIWVALYAYTQSLPFYLSGGDLRIMGIWFIVSAILIYFVHFHIFFTKFVAAREAILKYRPYILGVIVFAIISTLFFSFQEIREPIIDDSGFIFWNAHPFVRWTLAVASIVWGSVFGFVLFQTARIAESKIARAKAYVLSLDGFAWGIASFFYFPSESAANTAIAFILALVSFFATAIVFWWARIVGRRQENRIDTNV